MKRTAWAASFLFVITLTSLLLYRNRQEGPHAPLVKVPPASPPKPNLQRQEARPSITQDRQSLERMRPRQERMPKSNASPPVLNFRQAKLESHPLLAGTGWRLWPDGIAKSKKSGVPQKRVLGEVSGYYVIAQAGPVDLRQFSTQQPLVVIDPRLEIVGVVTGVLSVVLKEGASPDFLKEVSGLRVQDSFPDIRTFFVTSEEDPFDLVSLVDLLRQEPPVERVQLEVLSRQYEKF